MLFSVGGVFPIYMRSREGIPDYAPHMNYVRKISLNRSEILKRNDESPVLKTADIIYHYEKKDANQKEGRQSKISKEEKEE